MSFAITVGMIAMALEPLLKLFDKIYSFFVNIFGSEFVDAMGIFSFSVLNQMFVAVTGFFEAIIKMLF